MWAWAGMQKIASNYVSGLVLIERALRIGDNVRVGGFEGPDLVSAHAHHHPRQQRP